MKCKYCLSSCIKKGILKQKYRSKQRYQCKDCGKYQLEFYTYRLYCKSQDKALISLLCKSMAVSGIASHLGYSKQTIGRRILQLANKVTIPIILERNQVYEVDEMWTYVGNKRNPIWLTYALNRKTKRVLAFSFGPRNKASLKHVIDTLKSLHPKKIVTDKLNCYPQLVSPNNHDTSRYRNNRIERANLTLRQHLKRLSRKTLSYSKSTKMLIASFKLYMYWNNWTIEG